VRRRGMQKGQRPLHGDAEGYRARYGCD
jgi:hypothetical protein